MKIFSGFVTNSSSTSFVLSSKKDITKKRFLESMGVKSESLLIEFYENLFAVLEKKKILIPGGVNIRTFINSHGIHVTDENDIAEIERRYNAGEQVYYGELADSGDIAETYHSIESFVVIGNDFYFNARSNGY